MQQALADFRIESDQVVYLAFTDGRSYRVNPRELDRFLDRGDLRRVRQALRLRQQFMRRVLPPMALIVVLAGIIGLARYDLYRVAQSWLAPPPVSSQEPVRTVAPPASAHPAASTPATTPAAATGSDAAAADAATVWGSAAAQRPSGSGRPATTAPIVSQPSGRAVSQPRLPLVPVSTPIPVVSPILAPVTTPLNRTVQQLPKLLP